MIWKYPHKSQYDNDGSTTEANWQSRIQPQLIALDFLKHHQVTVEELSTEYRNNTLARIEELFLLQTFKDLDREGVLQAKMRYPILLGIHASLYRIAHPEPHTQDKICVGCYGPTIGAPHVFVPIAEVDKWS